MKDFETEIRDYYVKTFKEKIETFNFCKKKIKEFSEEFDKTFNISNNREHSVSKYTYFQEHLNLQDEKLRSDIYSHATYAIFINFDIVYNEPVNIKMEYKFTVKAKFSYFIYQRAENFEEQFATIPALIDHIKEEFKNL
jgi:hypothetical protein